MGTSCTQKHVRGGEATIKGLRYLSLKPERTQKHTATEAQYENSLYNKKQYKKIVL